MNNDKEIKTNKKTEGISIDGKGETPEKKCKIQNQEGIRKRFGHVESK